MCIIRRRSLCGVLNSVTGVRPADNGQWSFALSRSYRRLPFLLSSSFFIPLKKMTPKKTDTRKSPMLSSLEYNWSLEPSNPLFRSFGQQTKWTLHAVRSLRLILHGQTSSTNLTEELHTEAPHGRTSRRRTSRKNFM